MTQGTQSWCSVTTWREGGGREVGGGFIRERTHVCLWLIHVDVWQKPSQYCKVIICQLKQKERKEIREQEYSGPDPPSLQTARPQRTVPGPFCCGVALACRQERWGTPLNSPSQAAPSFLLLPDLLSCWLWAGGGGGHRICYAMLSHFSFSLTPL